MPGIPFTTTALRVSWAPILLALALAVQVAGAAPWRVAASTVDGVPTLTSEDGDAGLGFDLTVGAAGHEMAFSPWGGVPVRLRLEYAAGMEGEDAEPEDEDPVWELEAAQAAAQVGARGHTIEGVEGGEVWAAWELGESSSLDFRASSYGDIVRIDEVHLEAGSALVILSTAYGEDDVARVIWRLQLLAPAGSRVVPAAGGVDFLVDANATRLSFATSPDEVERVSQADERGVRLTWVTSPEDSLALVLSFEVPGEGEVQNETDGDVPAGQEGSVPAYLATAVGASASILLLKLRALRLWGGRRR